MKTFLPKVDVTDDGSGCPVLVSALCLLMCLSPLRARASVCEMAVYDRSRVPCLHPGTDMTDGVSLGQGLSLTEQFTIVSELLPPSFFSPHNKNHNLG